MSKRATLLFIAILAVSSLILVESAFAQSITKPSVPEFTVNLIGYNRIDVKIKNQPFTPYNNTEGDEVNLYYTVRVKDHFEEDWSTPVTYSESDSAERIPQSSSEYTVVTIPADYLDGGTVDFQVRAMLGHYYDPMAGRPIIVPYVFVVDGTSGWSEMKPRH